MAIIDYRGALGDTICLTAFLPELSEKFNEKITVITIWPDVFKHNKYVKEIINPKLNLPKNIFFNKIKSLKVFVSLYRYIEKHFIIKNIEKDYYKIDQDYLFNDRHRHLMNSIATQLDLKYYSQIPHISINEKEEKNIEKTVNCKEPYFVISPYAGWKSRLWEKGEFLKVSEWLLKNNFKVLEVGGPNDIYQGLGENYVGKLNLREVFALIKKSKGFVGVDSGLSHAAVSLQTPSVVIYGPVLAPLRKHAKYSYPVQSNAACIGCSHFLDISENNIYRECPFGHRNCMRSIKASNVIDKIKLVLE